MEGGGPGVAGLDASDQSVAPRDRLQPLGAPLDPLVGGGREEGLLGPAEADLHAAAIRGHDPERALERGYAIPLDADGSPLASAAAIREASDFELRMADGHVPARVREEVEE